MINRRSMLKNILKLCMFKDNYFTQIINLKSNTHNIFFLVISKKNYFYEKNDL